ncbi:MAG: hypothetical protein ACT4PV_09345 [Planctomycetaceae bacterium]
MTFREGLLLLAMLAAAAAAAMSFHPGADARASHDPRHAEAFDACARHFPIVGAVRVRTEEPDAALRAAAAGGETLSQVLRLPRGEGIFSRQRLLFGSDEEIEAIRSALREGRVPDRLPDLPDLSGLGRTAAGPWTFEAILAERAGLRRIGETLPAASLSGEPVLRDEEKRPARGMTRALVVALAFACLGAALLHRHVRTGEHRLLAAAAPLAILGLSGATVDPATLLAALLVASAGSGAPLLCCAAGLFFPTAALHKAGFVLVLGGLLRWNAPPGGAIPRRGPTLWAAGLALALATAPLLLPMPLEEAGAEPAVALVPPQELAARASDLRAAGLGRVEGDADYLPPPPSAERQRHVREIFRRAEFLERSSEGARRAAFAQVAEAAAMETPYLPPELRARLVTSDGRAVLWLMNPPEPSRLVARSDLMSPSLYRARGAVQARAEGRAAGPLAFLGGALLLLARRRASAALPLLAAGAGVLAGALPPHPAGEGGGGALVLPLLAAAALAPSWTVLPVLGAAALLAPHSLGWPAAAMALASLVAMPGAGGVNRLRPRR